MLKICIASSLFFTLNVFGKNFKSSSELRRAINSQMTKKKLMSNVRELIQAGKPNRFMGSDGHKKAIAFIENELRPSLKNSGVKLSRQTFSPNIEEAIQFYQKDFASNIATKFSKDSAEYKKWDNITKSISAKLEALKETQGINLIWHKQAKRQTDKTLVVSAHYDTILQDPETFKIDTTSEMPGADGNASGVSIAIEVANFFARLDLSVNLEIVFLDFQGLGYLGSLHHAKELDNKTVVGVVNLEMLGHDSSYFDKEKKYANMSVYLRAPKSKGHVEDKELLTKLKSDIPAHFTTVEFNDVANDFNQSDNFRYWERGIASVTFSQNWESDFNKNHLSRNDRAEMINQKTFVSCGKYILHALGNVLLSYK